MARYRKKPVTIDARQIPDPRDGLKSQERMDALAAWCDGEIKDDAVDGFCLMIATPEGRMKGRPGDWLIRGVGGEFYPCKPDIFAKTYEPVPEGAL